MRADGAQPPSSFGGSVPLITSPVSRHGLRSRDRDRGSHSARPGPLPDSPCAPRTWSSAWCRSIPPHPCSARRREQSSRSVRASQTRLPGTHRHRCRISRAMRRLAGVVRSRGSRRRGRPIPPWGPRRGRQRLAPRTRAAGPSSHLRRSRWRRCRPRGRRRALPGKLRRARGSRHPTGWPPLGSTIRPHSKRREPVRSGNLSGLPAPIHTAQQRSTRTPPRCQLCLHPAEMAVARARCAAGCRAGWSRNRGA
eukprot:scaffold109912_cov75-Phaeocystis_antarctica.AAC.1